MEHIVQFGINIDDEAIKRTIIETAAEAVMDGCREELGLDGGYYAECKLRDLVASEVDKHFIELEPKIIEMASDKLAERMCRTKKVKEATQAVLDKMFE